MQNEERICIFVICLQIYFISGKYGDISSPSSVEESTCSKHRYTKPYVRQMEVIKIFMGLTIQLKQREI